MAIGSLALELVAAAAGEPGCLRVIEPAVAGSWPLAAQFESADCGAVQRERGLRIDPVEGLARAARDLSPGEVIIAPPRGVLAAVRPGQPLRLQARIGAVLVERTVHAVRPAAPGAAVFVQAPGGAVFVAAAATVRP